MLDERRWHYRAAAQAIPLVRLILDVGGIAHSQEWLCF